jgi:hypothetical protein
VEWLCAPCEIPGVHNESSAYIQAKSIMLVETSPKQQKKQNSKEASRCVGTAYLFASFPTSECLAAGIMFFRSDGFAWGLDDDNPGIKTCCMETANSPILCTEPTFARR